MTFDDSFSIELNSPIDEESWKVIEDAEFDNTKHVYFTTPSCKRVDFIKADVLDKIRAEIEQLTSRYSISKERGGMGIVEWSDRLIEESDVLQVIDKYKADKEDKE